MDSFVASAASVNLGLVHPTSSPLAVSAAARGPRGAQPQPPYERALTENRFPVSGPGHPTTPAATPPDHQRQGASSHTDAAGLPSSDNNPERPGHRKGASIPEW